MSVSEIVDQIIVYLKAKKRATLAKIASNIENELIIDLDDLAGFVEPKIMAELLDTTKPIIEEVLSELKSKLQEVLVGIDPDYQEKIPLHIGFKNAYTQKAIADISAKDVNQLIRIKGLVVSQSEKYLKPYIAALECPSCGTINYSQEEEIPYKMVCKYCGKVVTPKLDENQTKYRNYQTLVVQELPENLRAKELPPTIVVDLYDSLVNRVNAGDVVIVDGIVAVRKITKNRKTPTFRIILKALYIEPQNKELLESEITEKEKIRFHMEAQKEKFIENLVKSFAPDIKGHEKAKLGILLALVGGAEHKKKRSVLHVLLVGDPSTAKSSLLLAVKDLLPSAIYATGNTATGVGLTAAVGKDAITGAMTISIGPVIQAHGGICLIDELDKMTKEDQHKLNDSMERGAIKVDKASIHVELPARTTIIAAANPKLERWDPYRTPTENIALPATLISRFALIFVFRDVPDPNRDKEIAMHILMGRIKEHKYVTPYPLDFLRKFILYARQFDTTLTEETIEQIAQFYQEMRQKGNKDTITLATRQLEDIARLSEAFAKLRLHSKVTEEDVKSAIDLFIAMLKEVGYDPQMQEFDIYRLMVGLPKNVREQRTIAITLLQENSKDGLSEKEFYELMEAQGVQRQDAVKVLRDLKRENIVYMDREGKYRLV